MIPARFAISTQSGKGKKASEAITEPFRSKPSSFARSRACFKASTREVCPTPLAKKNLKDENCKENVFVVGNTVIDALFMGLEKIKNEGYEKQLLTKYNFIDFSKISITFERLNREKNYFIYLGLLFEN